MEVSVEVNVSPWRLMLLKCTLTMSCASRYKDFPAKYATSLRGFAWSKLLFFSWDSFVVLQLVQALIFLIRLGHFRLECASAHSTFDKSFWTNVA